jgi:hypothetical protein
MVARDVIGFSRTGFRVCVAMMRRIVCDAVLV